MGHCEELLHPFGLRPGDLDTELGDEVVPAALVVRSRGRRLGALLDKPAIEHPLDGAVQRAGSHDDRSAGSLPDLELDAMPVALLIEKGQQDLELGNR